MPAGQQVKKVQPGKPGMSTPATTTQSVPPKFQPVTGKAGNAR